MSDAGEYMINKLKHRDPHTLYENDTYEAQVKAVSETPSKPIEWLLFHDNHGFTKAEGPETAGAVWVVEKSALVAAQAECDYTLPIIHPPTKQVD